MLEVRDMKNKIREFLKVKNLKVRDLVHETGLSKSYIYDILRDNSVPSLINARKIANVLEADIEEIFPLNKDF